MRIESSLKYKYLPQRVFDDLVLDKKIISQLPPWMTTEELQRTGNNVFGKIDVNIYSPSKPGKVEGFLDNTQSSADLNTTGNGLKSRYEGNTNLNDSFGAGQGSA